MKYEDFKALTEEEQEAAYIDSSRLDDLEAERNSFKDENEALTKKNQELQEELRKTKELNFSLSRKVAAEPKKSAEEIMNELFK